MDDKVKEYAKKKIEQIELVEKLDPKTRKVNYFEE